jgi:D-glycero-D-manno-heptose 1,7-bisphosphate phosphatase
LDSLTAVESPGIPRAGSFVISRGGTISFPNINFVFLDRDGVINRKAPESEYVTSWDRTDLLPGVEQAIALLNRSSRRVIVVTNQRGIALGLLSEPELNFIHQKLQLHLAACGAHIDAIYFCPHDHDECSCRKPGTGMFKMAFRDFPGAAPDNSVMIGDSASDILAGAALGMKTLLITEHPNSLEALKVQPSASGRSLLEVVESYLS